MSSYRRGSDRERLVAENLRVDGWVVYRSAGSHGCADLVALKAGHVPLLIQVKGSVRPFEHFGPAERVALEYEAAVAGAVPWLVHWPPRKRWAWVLEHGLYGVFDWPNSGHNGNGSAPGWLEPVR